MQEYERAETTVVNAYVRPEVSKYITNLQARAGRADGPATSSSPSCVPDGGLASGRASAQSPVNMLMSGPAGGVAGALYFCSRAGYDNILTFDMGGTSTDVALIQNGKGPGAAGNHRRRRALSGRRQWTWAHRRRRRGLYRFCPGADPRAARRSAVRRGRSRSGGLHERGRGTHGM